MVRRAGATFLMVFALVAGGCGSARPVKQAELVIAPAQYATAFDAAVEALVDLGFEFERIDARLGIITTAPKRTAGLASPWDREQSTMKQEIEDVLNRHFRRATVVFRVQDEDGPEGPIPQTVPGPAAADLRLAERPLVMRAEVSIERLHRPGWRLEPSTIRFSSRAFDPDWPRAGMWPQYTVAFTQDRKLSARLMGAISAAVEVDGEGEASPSADARP